MPNYELEAEQLAAWLANQELDEYQKGLKKNLLDYIKDVGLIGFFANTRLNDSPFRKLVGEYTSNWLANLEQKLTHLKQKHTNYLNQRKAQLTQEIQLIKEALHD